MIGSPSLALRSRHPFSRCDTNRPALAQRCFAGYRVGSTANALPQEHRADFGNALFDLVVLVLVADERSSKAWSGIIAASLSDVSQNSNALNLAIYRRFDTDHENR